MASRSIYSREQRLAPGTYENPLSDFLNSLPDYINEFQQNQLKLGRQQLEDKRYDDTKAIAETKRGEDKTQREYTNELNLLKLIPEHARPKVMKTSENVGISEIGDKLEDEATAFQNILNPTEGTDAENLIKYKDALNAPNNINNPTRQKQLKAEIKKLTNASYVKSITDYYTDNPDDKLKAINLQRAQYEPEAVIKDINKRAIESITGTRETIKLADGYMYYKDTLTKVKPNIKMRVPMGSTIEAVQSLYDAARSDLRWGKDMSTTETNKKIIEINKYKKELVRIIHPILLLFAQVFIIHLVVVQTLQK